MKTSKKTIISSVTILALLLGAAVILQLFAAPPPVTANVTFDPDTIDLGAPGWTVKEVVVTVWFGKGKYDVRDIDPKTVMVDGVLEPKGGWKHTWVEHVRVDEGNSRRRAWVFRFILSGSTIRGYLEQIIGHMTPGVVKTVPLEVTGNFNDGSGFAGTGYIYVVDPPTENPNPLPF